MHRISFQSRFHFGDLVHYQSYHSGLFQGRVTEITLSEDGEVHYGILCEDGVGQFGLYPDDMRLLEKATPAS